MRIIAGKYKSRIIRMPRSKNVRPTKDRIRQALFNILGRSIDGAYVADLFAGSGAYGLEALSRGASHAVFVEDDRVCAQTILENLNTLKIAKNSWRVLRKDVFHAICSLAREGKKFDIVFLDPPYYKNTAKKCLIKLDSRDILTTSSVVVVEHHKKDILPQEINHITSYRTVCYGDICLTFYKVKKST